MARKKTVEGETEYLIDVQPENAKLILKAARELLKAKEERNIQGKRLREKVKSKKDVIRSEIAASGVLPLEDGSWRVPVDDMVVVITPTDDDVKIEMARPKATNEP